MTYLDITTLTLLVIIAVLFLTLAFAVASLSYKAREAPPSRRDPLRRRRASPADRRGGARPAPGRAPGGGAEDLRARPFRRRGGGAPAGRWPTLKAEKENLGAAREEIEQVKQEAAAAAGERAERKQELAELEEEMERIRAELDPDRIERLRRERAEIEAEVARVRGELGPIRAEYDAALADHRRGRGRAGAGRGAEGRDGTAGGEARRAAGRDGGGARCHRQRPATERDDVRRDRDAAAAERDGAIVERDRIADERVRLEARVAALKRRGSAPPRDRRATRRRRTVRSSWPTSPSRRPRSSRRPACVVRPGQEPEALHDVSTYLEKMRPEVRPPDAPRLPHRAQDQRRGPADRARRRVRHRQEHPAATLCRGARHPFPAGGGGAALGQPAGPARLLQLRREEVSRDRARPPARPPRSVGEHRPVRTDAPKRRDHMALVLLDEMNLARVEYYFSEFLSRLEARPPWRTRSRPGQLQGRADPRGHPRPEGRARASSRRTTSSSSAR